MSSAWFPIPARLLQTLAIAPTLVAVCSVTGCRPNESSEAVELDPRPDTPPPEIEMAWEEKPLGGVAAGTPAPFAVKEGASPLVYLTEQGETIRVVDRTPTTDTILAESVVPARTIVRVDERNGVVFGKQTLKAGPLPAGRRYAILIVPTGENVTRIGRTQERTPEPEPDEQVTDVVSDPTGTGVEPSQ